MIFHHSREAKQGFNHLCRFWKRWESNEPNVNSQPDDPGPTSSFHMPAHFKPPFEECLNECDQSMTSLNHLDKHSWKWKKLRLGKAWSALDRLHESSWYSGCLRTARHPFSTAFLDNISRRRSKDCESIKSESADELTLKAKPSFKI